MEPQHLNRRRVAAIGTSLAAFAIVVGLTGAMARNDDGANTFFLESGPIGYVARHAETTTAWVRSLAIRPRAVRHAASARRVKLFARTRAQGSTKVAARAPTPPRRPVLTAQAAPVTIYTDQTLQPGDAVMMATGIRVFRGGKSLPHRESDFVALTRAEGLTRKVTRTLASLDVLPGG